LEEIDFVEGVNPFASEQVQALPSGIILMAQIVNLSYQMNDNDPPYLHGGSKENPNSTPSGEKGKPGSPALKGPSINELPPSRRFMTFDIKFAVYNGPHLRGNYMIQRKFPVSNIT